MQKNMSYSFDIKLKTVKMYLDECIGSTTIAKELNLSSNKKYDTCIIQVPYDFIHILLLNCLLFRYQFIQYIGLFIKIYVFNLYYSNVT